MKADRFDAGVRVEGVLVEENRTARKVGHVKSFMKNIVFGLSDFKHTRKKKNGNVQTLLYLPQ